MPVCRCGTEPGGDRAVHGAAFRRQIAPEIPVSLNEVHYAIAAIHGLLGTVAELLALYVVLVAGTNILPKRLRFLRYKRWMRLALAFWWIELLLGLAMYVQWYGLPRRINMTRSVTMAVRP